MERMQTKFQIFKNPRVQFLGVLLLMLLAGFLLCFNQLTSRQATDALTAQVRFEGEYRIGDSPWQPIVEGQHISSTKGDVTLRGIFHMFAPDGEYVGIYTGDIPIALYANHINLTIREGENEPVVLDTENPLYLATACRVFWEAYSLVPASEAPIEILIHNPHRFGNENAIDELLAKVALWGDFHFERDIMDRGQSQRNVGFFFIVVALVLLGSALFSELLHVQRSRIIWLFGASILAAGVYLLFSSDGVSFWSDSTALNTSALGFSIMFYMLFNSATITSFLKKTKKVGYIATTVSGVLDGIYFLLPVMTNLRFFDTWLAWAITQTMVNLVLLGCMAREFRTSARKDQWKQAGMALLVLAFEADVIGTAMGIWEGGFISILTFFILFVVALIVILRIIPERINAAAKANELELQKSRLEAEKRIMEAQLKDSRISIMLSQIQPHFIYNTLGTIERMCLKDPQKAFDLVRNFTLYLRGNFSELDSVTPIRFAEELKHVEYYANIEKVRFPDMEITYDVEATDFVLPALSVQPLVENAIKHGLMRLESGGTVRIHSFETPTHFCVEVKDDGVGFDLTAPIEEKKHVGLRNIRGRLKAMVSGQLIVESQPGQGTRALILIPKEVNP